jgi:hypothetical protein
MKFNVNADLFRNVARAVSTESTRYYLNGVFIEPHPCGGTYLVATDGHRMIVAYDPQGETDGRHIVPAPRDLLRQTIRKRARGISLGDARRIVATGNAVQVRSGGDIVASFAIEAIDGVFPDWSRVVPAMPEHGSASAHNPAYVSDLMDLAMDLRACGWPGLLPRMMSAGEGSPSVITYGADAPVFALLMPIRSSEAAMPAFYGAKPYDSPIVSMTSPYRPIPNDRPVRGTSFSVSVKRSPMHDETRRAFEFPSHAAAVRAFNRLRKNLEARGATDLPPEVLPESVIPLDKIKDRNRRVDAIDNAAAVFTAATDEDLAMPWRRNLIALTREEDASYGRKAIKHTITMSLAEAVGRLPHVSESRLLATAYRMAA